MKVVFKYALTGVETSISLPPGAEVIHVGAQRDSVCLWVLQEPQAPQTVDRKFFIVGTGHHEVAQGMRHVGSVVLPAYVWHVFEVQR